MTTPTLPPAPRNRNDGAARNYLLVAFGASLVIHSVVGTFFNYKPPAQKDQVVEKVSISKKVVIPTPPPPTPPPKPTPPPPTPPPSTPPPVTTTAPPPVPKIKLNVVKTHNDDKAPTEQTYVAPPKGNENGIPQGNAATGNPVVASTAAPSTLPPATPAPTPTPVPTPVKPSCATPNQDASVVNKVDPEYPDVARQAGASGTVRVQVNLSETGAVVGTSVYQSSGNGALDQAAMAAARQSSYQPEIVDCTKTAKSYLFVASFEAQ